MKHLKILSCILTVVCLLGLPEVSHAQWTQGGMTIVGAGAIVKDKSGSGDYNYGGGLAEAICSSGPGTADISVTYTVTWTWQGVGDGAGFSYTPTGVVTGSAFWGAPSVASSGAGWTGFSASSNTDDDGNPYSSRLTNALVTIAPGLTTYTDTITATASVDQGAMAAFPPGCMALGRATLSGDNSIASFL